MWGYWRFEKESRQLIINKSIVPGEEGKDLYKIDLVRCNTSAAILDVVISMSQKLWVTREDIGNLIEALDDIFMLQVNFCGSEFEHSDGHSDYAKRILDSKF